MNAAFSKSVDDRNTVAHAIERQGHLRTIRAVKPILLVVMLGVLLGLAILRGTSVFSLLPYGEPKIWISSGCGAAEAAVRAAQHAEPERPVFLIPLDQVSEVTRDACHETLAALDAEGYWWLRHFSEPWLCQRFAADAAEYFDDPILVPRFYVGEQKICDGLCEGAFERLGRPELQQYVTFVKPSVGGSSVPSSSMR